MVVSPWMTFTVATALPAHEVVWLLQQTIPSCCRRPDWTLDKPYFCGQVDPATGGFRLRANVAAKARGVSPTLVGCLRPTAQGTVIEASISPSAPFWLGLLILCFLLAFIPIGVLTWLLSDSMKASELVAFILFPLIGAMMTSWLWGTLIVLHYVYRSRYVGEFNRLLERVAERTTSGQLVVDVPETPKQRAAKQQLQTRVTQNGLKILAACFAAFGGLMFCVGVKGVVTKELTTYTRHRTEMHGPRFSRATTISGDMAVTASIGLLVFGVALALTSGVAFLASRRTPTSMAWPPLETALLALVALLTILGLVWMSRGFG